MKIGLFKILVANIASLIINIINSFILPKYLSIDTYAILKTYTFYVGYSGFLTLGFADGMYLKYGGKELNAINGEELGTSLKSFFTLEVLVCLILSLISICLKNYILLAVAFGSLFINMIGYHKNLYQAVGEYDLYGKSLNYQAILLFLANIVLIFIVKSDNVILYILIQIVSALAIAIYLSIIIEHKNHLLKRGKIKLTVIKENVYSGFTLMLGNFSSSLFTGLDRWFVKILLNNTSFALYSFSVSLENIINVFVTPITISLYNAFCKRRDVPYVKSMKCISLLWGLGIIAAAYPVKYILIHYLTEYQSATFIIFPLFAAQVFYCVIKGIHVNIYKAEQKQKKYFLIMMILVVVASILNTISYIIYKSEVSFAIATLVTSIIWFVFCEFDSPEFRFGIREYLTIIIMLSTYFSTCMIGNSWLGLSTYLLVLFLVSSLLMKNTVSSVFEIIRDLPTHLRRTH